MNKFITKKTIEGADYLQKKADEFVIEVKNLIKEKGIENVYNSDQSRFQLEVHSGRTLSIEGESQVECLVQCVAFKTHSYTIQPTISGDGRLLSPLYIVLKEKTGEFGPVVSQELFRPANIYAMASKSGKLTSDHFKTWLKECTFGRLMDWALSFSRRRNHFKTWLKEVYFPTVGLAVEEVEPTNKEITLKIIPKGTTGKIQPLDVFGFRVWKNYVMGRRMFILKILKIQ
ncbi:hypothetical protein TSAR_008214 [Trichomalopsis sarcophagae]|uniref:Uncharacterized protein n=1 Tax=Trichomalopsis sarcophagae TaxID=543379 RepID=A0A232ERX8_9HYME|nr:hypothetical protein TSAR_008214 [Trichomalopsis sarcophagae]